MNHRIIRTANKSAKLMGETEHKRKNRSRNVPENIRRNWEEDYILENGKYLNQCLNCQSVVYGHKRRMICKLCENELNK
jgi:hypothetical protein